jgi:hypothetical protein
MHHKPAILAIAAMIVMGVVTLPVMAVTTSYHIGNSLTLDSQPMALEGFAASRGFQHEVGYHIRASSSLKEILENPSDTTVTPNEFGTFNQALPNNHWDIVTIQTHNGQGSTLGTDVDSILSLINMTRSNPTNAQTNFYIYESWPIRSGEYQSEWNKPSLNELSTVTLQRKEHFYNVIERVRDATDANVYMVPVGDVLYELDVRAKAGEIPGFSNVNTFYRDGLHMRYDIGRFVASATTFATVLGQYPNGLEKPEGFFEQPVGFGPGVNLSPIQKALILDTIRDVLDKHPYSGVRMPQSINADFNEDNIVDELDLQILQSSLDVTQPYDSDFDGDVDGRDFLVWQRTYHSQLTTEDLARLDRIDFNNDGSFNAQDLQIWSNSYHVNSGGDVDGDNDTDGRDLLLWQRLASASSGDMNHDLLIDGVELAAWKSSYGFDIAADANLDGVVNEADLAIWQAEEGLSWDFPYAMTAPPLASQQASLATVVVPEPSIGMLGWSACYLISYWSRRYGLRRL